MNCCFFWLAGTLITACNPTRKNKQGFTLNVLFPLPTSQGPMSHAILSPPCQPLRQALLSQAILSPSC